MGAMATMGAGAAVAVRGARRERRASAAWGTSSRSSATAVAAPVAGMAQGEAKATLMSKLAYVQRGEANELLLQLEAANAAKEAAPASSPLFQGSWKFSYMGGVTPGPVDSPTRPIALLMYAG